MQLHISSHDGVPIYLQIVNQVKYLVASGRLEPGEELPPIRTLAEQLLINPNTVARAYRELEASGIIETRGRNGTFVAFDADPARQQLQRAAAAFAAQVHDLRLDTDEALAAVTAALRSAGPATA